MLEKDFKFNEKIIAYIEFLNNNMRETGEDDWCIPFLNAMLKFKTEMALKYNELHKKANEYAKNKAQI